MFRKKTKHIKITENEWRIIADTILDCRVEALVNESRQIVIKHYMGEQEPKLVNLWREKSIEMKILTERAIKLVDKISKREL